MTKLSGAEKPRRELDSKVPEIQLPVLYNKGGKEVRASGVRFTPRGCVVVTKSPHTCGTTFSLKITNPKSNRSIQVDSSVILRKSFATKSNWSMVVRFMNVSEREWDEMNQILTDAAAGPVSNGESKFLKSPIRQAILRYFNVKKLVS
ncbi:MAG: hypothetical protein JSU72_11385 [Deltaproteobacteria bacterium]|nr:MAG: hypothetical protein JSU72_11385 [Deltaproteobacteria bacterium]